MKIFKFEMRRAFRSPGFYIALLIGTGIALLDWIRYGLYFSIQQDKWMELDFSLKYPVTLYESWIGGLGEKTSVLYFMILPFLVVIPYSISFYQDNSSQYIVSICTRIKKSNYLKAKFTATFIIGGIVSVTPLLLNFVLNAIVLPGVLPQVALGGRILPKSTFSQLYYFHPLAVSALYITFYCEKMYTVMLYPFGICMTIMAMADILELYEWQPVNFINPSFGEPRLIPFLFVTIILFIFAIWIFIYKGSKQDILK